MSLRAWVRPLWTALAVAAAAAAAQLGLAYGLSILLWAQDFSDPNDSAWAVNLTWVCWLSATAVVVGGISGGRVVDGRPFLSGEGARRVLKGPDAAGEVSVGRGLPPLLQAAIAVVAGVGALAAVPLVAIPARYAELADQATGTGDAIQIALIGVGLGVMVAFGVLFGRPLAWNVIASIAWIWLLALASVLVALGSGAAPDATKVALWGAGPPTWTSALATMLVAAVMIGAGIAFLAQRVGCSRVSVAMAGAPGPLLVAGAYLVAGPGFRPEAGDHFIPYLTAPYAAIAGLLGSLTILALDRIGADESSEATATAAAASVPAGGRLGGPVGAPVTQTALLPAQQAALEHAGSPAGYATRYSPEDDYEADDDYQYEADRDTRRRPDYDAEPEYRYEPPYQPGPGYQDRPEHPAEPGYRPEAGYRQEGEYLPERDYQRDPGYVPEPDLPRAAPADQGHERPYEPQEAYAAGPGDAYDAASEGAHDAGPGDTYDAGSGGAYDAEPQRRRRPAPRPGAHHQREPDSEPARDPDPEPSPDFLNSPDYLNESRRQPAEPDTEADVAQPESPARRESAPMSLDYVAAPEPFEPSHAREETSHAEDHTSYVEDQASHAEEQISHPAQSQHAEPATRDVEPASRDVEPSLRNVEPSPRNAVAFAPDRAEPVRQEKFSQRTERVERFGGRLEPSRSADGAGATQFLVPVPAPDPLAPPKPEADDAPLRSTEREEWADEENWLQQIRSDDPAPRPFPRPESDRARRKWSLFSEDD